MKQHLKLIAICALGSLVNAHAFADVSQRVAHPPRATQTPMHAHKPTLPVKIHAALPAAIAAAQPVTFTIDVSSTLSEGELEIQLVPLDELQLVAPTQALHYDLATGGLKTSVTATVIAPHDGTFGLSVEIRHSYADKSRSVARGVTLRVGDTARTAAKIQSSTSGSGEAVVSMPAQEDIQR